MLLEESRQPRIQLRVSLDCANRLNLPNDIQNGVHDDLGLFELNIVAGVVNDDVLAIRGQRSELRLQLLPDGFSQFLPLRRNQTPRCNRFRIASKHGCPSADAARRGPVVWKMTLAPTHYAWLKPSSCPRQLFSDAVLTVVTR